MVHHQGPERGPASSLRGWLSDVYFPALVDVSMRDEAISSLAARLGPKATVDDPVQGRAAGLDAVRALLDKTAAWLAERRATYQRLAFVQGVDRDATEGALALTIGGEATELPVAVVAERRKSREVEVRVYFDGTAFGAGAARAPLVAESAEVLLPPPIGELLDALAKGDVTAIGAQFEEEGAVRAARGARHAKKDGGLAAYFATRVAGGGIEVARGGTADDARTVALEITLTKAHGRAVAPQAGLLVFERGDSGLLRWLRVYGDLGA
jgi:hypothetical protein